MQKQASKDEIYSYIHVHKFVCNMGHLTHSALPFACTLAHKNQLYQLILQSM